MIEMAQKLLKLYSPKGGDPLVLKWPVATSEGKEGPEEIVDTIRLVCEDFPELTSPLETRILKEGEDVSEYNYEQTKALCERYNKAIESIRQLVKGSPRQKQLSKQASRNQLKHILQMCYHLSVKDPDRLNHYEPFSPEVYGETSFELVEQMIGSVKFSENDSFIDLGSGVGQVVLQVAAATNCKFCYGVEKADAPAEYAVVMEREFRKLMKWYGKSYGDFLIEKGDFLYENVRERLSKATIVFVNNFAFGPVVDHELKQRFANCLKEGSRIVSSKAFCPLNFRITARNLSDIGTIMKVQELSPLSGAVSWTGRAFAYYVHTIDRTLLEKYFARLKNPNKKDEPEARKDRRGRPVQSIRDRINGALAGGMSWIKTADTRPDQSRQDRGALVKQLKKKRMKSIKRLNNGALGQRKMQAGRKRERSESPSSVISKAAVKLRPRHRVRRSQESSISDGDQEVDQTINNAPVISTASGVSTTTSTASSVQSTTSPIVPPPIDSLNFLHAHTIMSTSGQDSIEKVSYNDRRMTESSSAFFKPSIQNQTVSMLEKHAGFLNMIENMKQQYLTFLTFMQTPQYRAMLTLQIEQERQRKQKLREKMKNLENDVSSLQKEGVELIKDRLKEIGIKSDNPREVINQAKNVILRHKELKAQTASLGAEINALQSEHNSKVSAHRKILERKLGKSVHNKNGFTECILASSQTSKTDQQKFLASVDSLSSDLQHLKGLNKSRDGTNMVNSLHAEHISQKGVELPMKGGSNQSIQMKDAEANEKFEIKKDFDSIGEVLSTLKKEVLTVHENPEPLQICYSSKPIPSVAEYFQRETHYNSASSVMTKLDIISEIKEGALKSNLSNGTEASEFSMKNKPIQGRPLSLTPNTTCSSQSTWSLVTSTSARLVAPISSSSVSSWTQQLKEDDKISKASPRILPPGTKIDIKRPSKPNGLKHPYGVSSRKAQPKHYTLLQTSPYSTSNTVAPKTSNLSQTYTDNEKAAAQNLIYLTEGVNSNLNINLSSRAPILMTGSNHHIYAQPAAVTSAKEKQSYSVIDHRPNILSTSQAHRGSISNIATTTNNSIPFVYGNANRVQVNVNPITSLSLTQSIAHSASSSQLLGNVRDLASCTMKDSVHEIKNHIHLNNSASSMKIVSPVQQNGLLKHKSLDVASQPPNKVRNIESKGELRSILHSAPALQPSSSVSSVSYSRITQQQTSQVLIGSNLLNPGHEQRGVLHSQKVPVESSIKAFTPVSQMIETASKNYITNEISGTTQNGIQSSLLKLLQQPSGQTSMLLAQKPSEVMVPIVATNNSSIGQTVSLPHDPASLGAALAKGQVKIVPQPRMDGKGTTDVRWYVVTPIQGGSGRASHMVVNPSDLNLHTSSNNVPHTSNNVHHTSNNVHHTSNNVHYVGNNVHHTNNIVHQTNNNIHPTSNIVHQNGIS